MFPILPTPKLCMRQRSPGLCLEIRVSNLVPAPWQMAEAAHCHASPLQPPAPLAAPLHLLVPQPACAAGGADIRLANVAPQPEISISQK